MGNDRERIERQMFAALSLKEEALKRKEAIRASAIRLLEASQNKNPDNGMFPWLVDQAISNAAWGMAATIILKDHPDLMDEMAALSGALYAAGCMDFDEYVESVGGYGHIRDQFNQAGVDDHA